MWLWLLTIPVGGYIAYRALNKNSNASHVLPVAPVTSTVPVVTNAPLVPPPIASAVSTVAAAVEQTISAPQDPEVSDGHSSADSSANASKSASSASPAKDVSPPPLAPSLTTTNPTLATIAKATAILPTPPVPPPIVGLPSATSPTLATIAKATAILPAPPVPPPIVGLPKVSAPKAVILPSAPAISQGFNFSPQALAVNKLQPMLDAIPLDASGNFLRTGAVSEALNQILSLMKQNSALNGKAPPAVRTWLLSHNIAANRI